MKPTIESTIRMIGSSSVGVVHFVFVSWLLQQAFQSIDAIWSPSWHSIIMVALLEFSLFIYSSTIAVPLGSSALLAGILMFTAAFATSLTSFGVGVGLCFINIFILLAYSISMLTPCSSLSKALSVCSAPCPTLIVASFSLIHLAGICSEAFKHLLTDKTMALLVYPAAMLLNNQIRHNRLKSS